MYFTNDFNLHFGGKTTDDLPEGECNKYIVHDTYNSDLTITGKLTVSCLEVLGVDLPYYHDICSNLQLQDDINCCVQTAISCISADQIQNGCVNKFIVNDVYDSSLTVTGTLITSRLVVLGMDLPDYDCETSNVFYKSECFEQDFNTYYYSKITDDILPGTSNSFIVNNIYDDNLIITGKLIVSSLEVLGIELGDYNQITTNDNITTSNIYSSGTITTEGWKNNEYNGFKINAPFIYHYT